jgi:capsular polysaccharide biosynthesis protein
MNEKREVGGEINEGISLLDLVNIIRSNLLLLFTTILVFLIGGVVYTYVLVTPMYTSSISLQIHIEKGETTGTDAVKTVAVTQVANNIMEYIKFPDLIKPFVVEYFATDNPQEVNKLTKMIAGRIKASQVGSASAVQITYSHENPEEATEILTQLVEELARRINLSPNDEESLKFSSETVKIINRPLVNPNQKPSSPNKVLNISLSIVVGVVAGVLIIFLKEQFKLYYSSKKEVEQFLQLPVLTIIDSASRR